MHTPEEISWYIEARPYVTKGNPPKAEFAPENAASMGSAVAVELRDKYGAIRKYLLTCSHVVRAEAKNGKPTKFWGALHGEICCFPPNQAYSRTIANGRLSGTHQGVRMASARRESGCGGVAGEVVVELRRETRDWILLDVRDEGFQDYPAVRRWGTIDDDSKVVVVGFPGGAGSSDKQIWKHLESVAVKRSDELRRESEPDPGMIKLSGAASRPGMSGCGIFCAKTGDLFGIHRSSWDLALEMHSIDINHIRERLAAEYGLRPVEWGQDRVTPDRDSTQADSKPPESPDGVQVILEAFALCYDEIGDEVTIEGLKLKSRFRRIEFETYFGEAASLGLIENIGESVFLTKKGQNYLGI